MVLRILIIRLKWPNRARESKELNTMLKISTTLSILTMLLIMFSRLSTRMLSRCTRLNWWKTLDLILMEPIHLLSTTVEAPKIRSLDRLTRYQTTIWGTKCLRLRLHMAGSQPFSNANLLCSSRMGAMSLELLSQTKKLSRSLMLFTHKKCKPKGIFQLFNGPWRAHLRGDNSPPV